MERKILCVCKGNTCRSPMMEAVLQNELAKLGLENATVESAGVLREAEGQSAHEFSRDELRNRGLNIESHVSRYIGHIGDLSRFDLILCVGAEEADQVREICPEVQDRIEVVNSEIGGIPNPWQLGPEAYRVCAETIERAMTDIAHRLKLVWQ